MSSVPYIFYIFYRFLFLKKVPFLPTFFVIVNRLIFGAYIPASCVLGKGTKFGYGGSGVVIHARAILGDNCTIGPAVTIGGRSREYGVPVIGNNIFVSGGAKILGNVSVGDGSIIGANAVVIKDVPPYCIAAGVPAKIIRTDIKSSEYI